MDSKPTEELDKLLENMNPKSIDLYLKDNKASMANGEKSFYYYMKDKFAEKHMKLKDVYHFAGVSESYGGKILRMEQKHTIKRDLIIRLCLAGHFDRIETNRALKLYGMSELYAKNPRDVCIIIAINHRIFDLDKIDQMLEERELERISNYKA